MDSQFLADTLTAMEPSEKPVTIATDGAYPTPGNQKLAEAQNVRIVSTNMPGKKANGFYTGFGLSGDGRIILACPGGIGPVSCSKPYKNGQMQVSFVICLAKREKSLCQKCRIFKVFSHFGKGIKL